MTAQLLQARVARRHDEAIDIASFELVAAGDGTLPAFSAGSHIDVHLPGGIVRQYSLCNDPDESHRYQIAVLKDGKGRGGSVAVHAHLQPGSVISISTPKNHFRLASDAAHHLLLAGGIGITPLMAMAERLCATDQSFTLHYCARSEDRAAFAGRLRNSRFSAQVVFHFDDGAAEQRLALADVLAQAQGGAHLYTCGPKGFMDAVLAGARSGGWAEERLHYEFFGSGQPMPQAGDDFEVKLASSGRVIAVARDESVLAALTREGVQIPYSCEQGVCGTCLTRVLEGEPDHRDMYLTPDEQAANDVFLPCCSRARTSRLVLDL